MKGTSFALLFVAALVAVGYAYPRGPADADEVLFVPLESRDASESAEDIEADDGGVGLSFMPNIFSLSNFFSSFMKKINDLVNISNQGLDGKKGNTTSTTKVVGNHVWTINDTVYENGDTGVYHVQTILVRPVEDTIENANPDTSESDSNDIPEKPTESSENEISKEKIGDREDPFQSSSDTNVFVTSPAIGHWRKPIYSRPYSHENLEKYPFISDLNYDEVDNKIDSLKPIDLSRDIAVNDLMEKEKGGLVNIDPDAELINFNDGTIIDPYSTMNRYKLPRYLV